MELCVYIKYSLIIVLACRSYKILNVLEFNSARKRMSVIVQDEDGKILLLCKGADRLAILPSPSRLQLLIFSNVFF